MLPLKLVFCHHLSVIIQANSAHGRTPIVDAAARVSGCTLAAAGPALAVDDWRCGCGVRSPTRDEPPAGYLGLAQPQDGEGERKASSYRGKSISLTLLTLLLLPLPGWSTALNLFVIQRNKNTNEVQDQLHVNDRCHLVSDHPVDAFWHLREVSPETPVPLTDLEQMVYGVTN
jgi:hypothetical protein